MEYRKHLQAFIDRWRYNANRGTAIVSALWYSLADGLVSGPGADEDQNSGEGSIMSG